MIQTKPKKSIVLPPASELGARFCQWFNHGWHWIYGETPAPGEKIQWFTEDRYPLQPRNLWQEYQNPDKTIGLRFSNDETRYCLLDIDRGSPYHPANNYSQFKTALGALEDIGLCRPLLVRSSDSEGIHVYYFLPVAAPTFALACAIKFVLEDAGFHLRSGHLESFPNCKSYSKGKPTNYNGHRLPLQAGSYYLDDDGQPLTDDLAQFLDAADVAAAHQDRAALEKAITAAAKNRRRLVFKPDASDKAAKWRQHLEERIAEGWSGRGQTNELLKDFAIYGVVWLALSQKALIDYVIKTAKAAPGFRQYCGHQQDIDRRAKEWTEAAEKWYSPYRSFPKRDESSYQETFRQPKNNIVNFENQANVSSRQQAAERIQQAVTHLKTIDALPHAATTRAAAIIATVKELTGKGMSFATLHRPYHLPLWHPGQKSLEAAQGAVLHPTSLYEGLGADERLPQPIQGGGSQPLIPLPEINSSPRADASASTPLEASTPTGEVGENWRLRGIWLKAKQRAVKLVKEQCVLESERISPDERQHRETVALMQLLWDSGEPAWMDEVERWRSAVNSKPDYRY